MIHRKHYSAGFTLVELAIVLVIIGLIVSGVLVGQDLIRQAQLRKVMNQLEQFDRATATFRLKYDYLPGDFPTAYATFGSFSSCTDTINIDFSSMGCNGDGNGHVSPFTESLLFWAHLSQAGLLAGSYTGFGSTSLDSNSSIQVNAAFIGGVNAPWIGPHKGIAWGVTTNHPGGLVKLGYVLGTLSNHLPVNPAFTPQESLTIDSKMDDGLPGTGRVNAMGTDCIASNDYDLSKTGITCTLGINIYIPSLLAIANP